MQQDVPALAFLHRRERTTYVLLALAVAALADCRAPYLIGVRHHSAVLANALPALLDAAAPDLVLLELPEELQPWLEWLGAEDLEAPVALAAARRAMFAVPI